MKRSCAKAFIEIKKKKNEKNFILDLIDRDLLHFINRLFREVKKEMNLVRK